MPNINLIPEIYYNPLDPYHYEYDNIPLRNIIKRLELVNFAVDINSNILRDSVGNQGTLSNRLNQSINEDGSLKTQAIDEAMHNIANHEDGSITIDNITYNYVKMLSEERSKLELISDEATALKIKFAYNNPSETEVVFEDETVIFENSDTVTWTIIPPNRVRAELNLPLSIAHQHVYDENPVHLNVISPNYREYRVNSISTPFIEGSLRVYINGIRLSETSTIYVYGAEGPSGNWELTSFTSDHENGTFELNRSISPNDIIRIDYDKQL